MAPTEFINGARESPMEMLTRVKSADAAASREVPADVNAAVASQLTALSAVVTLAMDALPAALARLQILEDTPLPDNAPISDVLQRKLALATFDRVLVVTRTAGDAAAAAAGTGLGGARQQRKRRSARSSTEVSDDRLQARSLRLPAGAAPENYLGSSAHGGTVTFSFQVGRLPARRAPRLVQAKAVGWRRSKAFVSDEAGAAATAGVCALNLSAPVSLKRKTGDGGVRQAASKRSRLQSRCIECNSVIKGTSFTCSHQHCNIDWGMNDAHAGLCNDCTIQRVVWKETDDDCVYYLCKGCDLACRCMNRDKCTSVGPICRGCAAICIAGSSGSCDECSASAASSAPSDPSLAAT